MKNTLSSVIRLFIQVAMLATVLLMLPEKSESFVNVAMENYPEKMIINTRSDSQRNTFSPIKANYISANTEANKKFSY